MNSQIVWTGIFLLWGFQPVEESMNYKKSKQTEITYGEISAISEAENIKEIFDIITARDTRISRFLRLHRLSNDPLFEFIGKQAKVDGNKFPELFSINNALSHALFEFSGEDRPQISFNLKERGFHSEDLNTLFSLIPEGISLDDMIFQINIEHFRKHSPYSSLLDQSFIDHTNLSDDAIKEYIATSRESSRFAKTQFTSNVLFSLSHHGRLVLINFLKEKYANAIDFYNINNDITDREILDFRKSIERFNKQNQKDQK